jgi:hypothetical protein
MSEHAMTTDAQARPTFACAAPRTAPLAGWYDEPNTTTTMHLEIEWDECPLWSFEKRVYLEHAGKAAE